MGQIRKQAIISSIVIYIGFFVGFINTWFFIRNGEHSFSPAEYGLTRLFFDVGQLMYAVAAFGMVSVNYKFFPYYRDNLSKKENDLYTWLLLIPVAGFLLVIGGGLLFEPMIVRKFSARSPIFVDYYHWTFAFGFGTLLFSILESFAWTYQKTVYSNFLKEAGLRLLTFVLIMLFSFNLINFDGFIKLFAFQFVIIALLLFLYLRRNSDLHFTFKQSRVTRKFKGKMLTLASYVYGGSLVMVLSQVADSIIITAKSENGIHDAGVYNLSSYIANLIQVPQRSIIAVTIAALSIAWKNKNLQEIERLYKRTSINLLLFGLFIFLGIWLNVREAFDLLHIQGEYKAGLIVIFILGITRIIDAGTGINGQIIATSIHWRFEFFTGILLILLILPLNYFLVDKYGIIGSAYANLISFIIYNIIRYFFLLRKYNLQPFNSKTILALLTGASAYFISYYLFKDTIGWPGIILRSSLFAAIFIAGVFALKLTPDALQLAHVVKKRFERK